MDDVASDGDSSAVAGELPGPALAAATTAVDGGDGCAESLPASGADELDDAAAVQRADADADELLSEEFVPL